MKKIIKNILIILAIVIVLAVGYSLISGGGDSNQPVSNLVSSNQTPTTTENVNSQISNDTSFLSTLLGLNQIRIDSSILESSTFKSLKDNSVPIVNDGPVGRTNPFYPFETQISETLQLVSSLPASQITTTTAILNGSISSEVQAQTRYFEWGEMESLGSTTTTTTQSLVGTFSKEITGLKSKTRYYFRSVAKTSNEIITGEVMSFETN